MVVSGIEDFLALWRNQLSRAAADQGHPWKTPVLSTLSQDAVHQRILVLRKYESPRTVIFYTDSRTQKVADLSVNPQISLLFWDPRKKLQLRLQGTAELLSKGDFAEAEWEKAQQGNTSDYRSVGIPASPISTPEEGWQTSEQSHFMVIKITFTNAELLQLRREGHLRADFQFIESEKSWQGEWLIP